MSPAIWLGWTARIGNWASWWLPHRKTLRRTLLLPRRMAPSPARPVASTRAVLPVAQHWPWRKPVQSRAWSDCRRHLRQHLVFRVDARPSAHLDQVNHDRPTSLVVPDVRCWARLTGRSQSSCHLATRRWSPSEGHVAMPSTSLCVVACLDPHPLQIRFGSGFLFQSPSSPKPGALSHPLRHQPPRIILSVDLG